jgi:hypothetical protein
LLTRFTSCLSLALRTLMSFLLLISTDFGFHLPEATWLPVLKQILRLKMEDTVVRRVPTFVVAFHLRYRRRNACAGESSDFAMCWDARIAHDRQGSVQRDAFRLTGLSDSGNRVAGFRRCFGVLCRYSKIALLFCW